MLERKGIMLRFYDIDPAYANYLRQFDSRIPNITYTTNSKFVCGIVLSIAGHNYFAPISSNKTRQQTNILIQDDNGTVLSSIKFSFMFPAPNSVISIKDFRAIRATDAAYADWLRKNMNFAGKTNKPFEIRPERYMGLDVTPITYYIGIVVIFVYWKRNMTNGLCLIQHSKELVEYQLFYKGSWLNAGSLFFCKRRRRWDIDDYLLYGKIWVCPQASFLPR